MWRTAIAVLALALSSSPAIAQEPVLPAPVYHVIVEASRPKPLMSLYATQVALQALDVYTTFRALDAGGRELNPVFGSGNRMAMVGTKAGVTVANIFLVEKLWRKNRTAAVGVMIATNALMSAVVVHNSLSQ